MFLQLQKITTLVQIKEEAIYDYDKDIYHYKVYNDKGDVVLSKLNYCITDTSENIRNAYGDFTKLLWTPSSTRKKHI